MTAAPERQTPAAGPGLEGQLAIDFAPQAYRKRPAAGTARADVLAALEAGESLTSLEAWQRFGTSRLAADVWELRRMGWPIESIETPVECREGRSARVACYRLANSAGGRQ